MLYPRKPQLNLTVTPSTETLLYIADMVQGPLMWQVYAGLDNRLNDVAISC